MMSARKALDTFALSAAFLLTVSSAFAQTVPASGNTSGYGVFSVTLNSTPVLVLPDPTLPYPSSNGGIVHTRVHELVMNQSTTASVACSRFNPTPTATDPKSFILSPQSNPANGDTPPLIDSYDPPKYVAQFPLYCVALPNMYGTAVPVILYAEAW